MCIVRPGFEDVWAIVLLQIAFKSEDLPTLERPRNVTSGHEPNAIVANFGADQRNFGVWSVKYLEACLSWIGLGGRVSQCQEIHGKKSLEEYFDRSR